MTDGKRPDDGDDAQVLVFRSPVTEAPVAVPSSVVVEAERPYRVYQRRLCGESWEEIAAAEGYPTPRAAQYDMERYLDEGKALIAENSRRNMLALEIARLDALQHAVWPAAMRGVLPAVSIAQNLVLSRIKVLGLDQAEDETSEGRTVVVPSDDEGYKQALERAAGGG